MFCFTPRCFVLFSAYLILAKNCLNSMLRQGIILKDRIPNASLFYFFFKEKASALFFSQRKQFPEFLYHFSPITAEKEKVTQLSLQVTGRINTRCGYILKHVTFGLPLRKHLLSWNYFISVCTISSPTQRLSNGF